MRPLVFVSILIFAVTTGSTQATCYWPNGEEAEGEVPCNDGSGATWCCGAGYFCGSNKLCIQRTPNKDGTLNYGRGSCTDKTFEDDKCPKWCYTKDEFGWGTGSAVTRCKGEEEKYYCATTQTVDCAKDPGVFKLEVPEILAPIASTKTFTETKTVSSEPTSSAQQGSTSTSASTSTSTGTTTSSANPSSNTHSGSMNDPDQSNEELPKTSKSNAIPIGVGVGVGVAVGILACMGLFFFLKRRRNTTHPQPAPLKHHEPGSVGYPHQPLYAGQPAPVYNPPAHPPHVVYEAANNERYPRHEAP